MDMYITEYSPKDKKNVRGELGRFWRMKDLEGVDVTLSRFTYIPENLRCWLAEKCTALLTCFSGALDDYFLMDLVLALNALYSFEEIVEMDSSLLFRSIVNQIVMARGRFAPNSSHYATLVYVAKVMIAIVENFRFNDTSLKKAVIEWLKELPQQ